MSNDSAIDPIEQDFRRDVWCLFGLPIDNLTLNQTKSLLRRKAAGGNTSVLSTINMNWVVEALNNPIFRTAVRSSETITIDGKPLLWISRLLGNPMTEVVSGSTLMQELLHEKTSARPLSVLLFGGEHDVARQAMEKINVHGGGLFAVDALNPGFGSVADMSKEDTIGRINAAAPDILLVALGAKKGTQWIAANRRRLNAKIISHLGATINFLAGTVRRAPRLMQHTGLEWVWRIVQEPALLKRYLQDGIFLTRWLVIHLPSCFRFRSLRKRFMLETANDTADIVESAQGITIRLGRNLLVTQNSPLRDQFSRCARARKRIALDFRETMFVDSTFIGIMLILMKHQIDCQKRIELLNLNRNVRKILRLFCASDLQTDINYRAFQN